MNAFQKKTIDRLEAHVQLGYVKFTEFEKSFISNMAEKPLGYNLTKKQNSLLNKLNTQADRV